VSVNGILHSAEAFVYIGQSILTIENRIKNIPIHHEIIGVKARSVKNFFITFYKVLII
jgi:hypothetical protein